MNKINSSSPKIASKCIKCRELFGSVCTILSTLDGKYSDQVSLPTVQDEFGRFRIWLGNTSGHRSGRVSLDYRLRESKSMRQTVVDFLHDLESNLQDGGQNNYNYTKLSALKISSDF